MILLLTFSFLAGTMTILAPCIWPLLPIVLAGSSGGRWKPIGVVLGIVLSFTIFTLFAAYLFRLLPVDPEIFRYIAVAVIILLGFSLAIPAVGARLEGLVSILSSRFGGRQSSGSGFRSGFITGLSLGLVWTPCAGPVLATIATLAATQAVDWRITLITISYSVGVGIPLLILAVAGNRIFERTRGLGSFTGKIQRLLGVIMIVTAIAIGAGWDKTLQVALLNYLPGYGNFLYKLEESQQVSNELDKLRGTKNMSNVKSLLPTLGEAPEIVGINNWLNSKPIRLSDLKGKVILVDFWTYTCINCIRTLPHITSWYEKYKDKGLVVIGVHTPEFEFEKKTENVQEAILKYKITYPVAQDNDYATWINYNNRYWPAKYLIDKNGVLRLTHFGEGNYEETEMAIQQLLAETGMPLDSETIKPLPDETPTKIQSPETYLGLSRMSGLANLTRPSTQIQGFELPESLEVNEWGLGGEWQFGEEYAQSGKAAILNYRFLGNKVFLVLSPADENSQVNVFIDGEKVSTIKLDTERLYELVDLKGKYGEHTLRLEFTPGIKAFAFTFG